MFTLGLCLNWELGPTSQCLFRHCNTCQHWRGSCTPEKNKVTEKKSLLQSWLFRISYSNITYCQVILQATARISLAWSGSVLHSSYMRELKGITEIPDGCRVSYFGQKVEEIWNRNKTSLPWASVPQVSCLLVHKTFGIRGWDWDCIWHTMQ